MLVIVPLDFSENSIKALEFALAIGDRRNAKIVLVHTVGMTSNSTSDVAGAPNQRFAEAESQLKTLLQTYQSADSEIHFEIVDGELSTTVLRIAKDEELPLIVMGMQGASGIKNKLIGSTTLDLIRVAECPVLVVPAQAHVSQVKKVTLALDFADQEEKFIDWIVDMSRRWSLGLEILHVQTKSDFNGERPALSMERYLQKKYPDIQTRIHTFYASAAVEGLELYMAEHNNMILVMCHQHENLWEQILKRSQSVQMEFHTHIPLLIMR